MAKKKPAAGAKPAPKKEAEVATDEAAAPPEEVPETEAETVKAPEPNVSQSEPPAELPEAAVAGIAETAVKLDEALTPAPKEDVPDVESGVNDEREPEFPPDDIAELPPMAVGELPPLEAATNKVKQLEHQLAVARQEQRRIIEAQTGKKVGPTIAPGKSLTTLTGLKGPGDPISPDDLGGGATAFQEFVDSGLILE